MDQPLVNRVANSPIITINLEHYFPSEEIVDFDLKHYLYMELMLKEKDFRLALKEHDWSRYSGKIVCIHCTADAIIPIWAYMLVATYASPVAHTVYQGRAEDYLTAYYRSYISGMDTEQYADRPIVIKGCSDKPVPPSAYMEVTARLLPVAKSIMFGEPCSTVPVYKRPKPTK